MKRRTRIVVVALCIPFLAALADRIWNIWRVPIVVTETTSVGADG